MKTILSILSSVLLVLAIQTTALAQSVNITEKFKSSFNETVQEVHNTDNALEKRAILNESFSNMLTVIDRIESVSSLSEDESAQLNSFKNDIEDKQSELNGLDGFDEVVDEDLDDFSSFSQDFFEQAKRSITIGVVTAALIVIILLLL